MTDKQLIKSVKVFLEERLYSYALMISGAWGCGKTFFVNNTLIPEIEKEYNCYYFSLYGIKDPQEITDGVCAQKIAKKVAEGLKKRIDPNGKTVRGALFVASKVSERIFNKLEISSKGVNAQLLEIFGESSKDVFIFDDLERCSCDISDVLGQINTFVEHTEAKVIVICNENEIGSANTEIGQELIDLRFRIDKLENNTTGSNKLGLGNPVQGTSNRNNINENEYLRIKEKVIGKTITYDPDLKMVFSSITKSKIICPELETIILEKIDEFVKFALENEHKNIRTFQFFLEKVSTLFAILEDGFSILKPYIVENCFRSSVQYMAHLEMLSWKNADFGWQQDGESFYSHRDKLAFKFVDDFITDDTLNKESVYDVLVRCETLIKAEAQLSDDPFNRIKSWYCAEDAELSTWLEQIKKKINDDYYSTVLYPELINTLVSILACKIHVNEITEVLDSIIQHLEKMPSDRYVPPEREHFFAQGEAKELYDYYFEKINDIGNEKVDSFNKELYLNEFCKPGNDWIKFIHSELDSNYHIRGKSYIYWLKPNDVIEKLRTCTNRELDSFRRLIVRTYEHAVYDNVKADVPHLKEYVKLIDEIDKSELGDLQSFIFDEIKYEIKSKLDLLEPDNE